MTTRQNAFRVLKVTGLMVLCVYLFTHPLMLSGSGILLFIALHVASSSVFGFLFYGRFIFQESPRDSTTHELGAKRLEQVDQGFERIQSRNRFWSLLSPGEDGLFFVPVLLFNFNVYVVLIASVFFALWHWPGYPMAACFSKGVSFLLLVLFVLPTGILTVVIGHVLVNLAVFFCSDLIDKLERRDLKKAG